MQHLLHFQDKSNIFWLFVFFVLLILFPTRFFVVVVVVVVVGFFKVTCLFCEGWFHYNWRLESVNTF